MSFGVKSIQILEKKSFSTVERSEKYGDRAKPYIHKSVSFCCIILVLSFWQHVAEHCHETK